MTNEVTFTTGTARLVQGDAYSGSTADSKGVPYVYKSGKKVGQGYTQFFMGVAIPKKVDNQGMIIPWQFEPWGQLIVQAAMAANPHRFDAQGNLTAGPPMAYKVADGDSELPDQNGKRWCDKQGFPGHWVLSLVHRGDAAPNTYHFNPTTGNYDPLVEPIIQRGGYVNVQVSVNGNGDHQNPGVFLAHRMVVHVGYGEPIIGGPDPSQAGFDMTQPLPNYVSATPIGAPAQMQPAQMQPAQMQGQVQAGQTISPQQVQQMQQPQQQGQMQAQQQGQIQPQQAQQAQQQGQMQPQQPQQQGQVQPANDLMQQQPQQAQMQQGGNPPPPQLQGQQQAAQEESYMFNGAVYTRSQLLSFEGWSEANLAGLQRAN